MGFYVHLHVAFACNSNDGVAALAKKHLAEVPAPVDGYREGGEKEAVWYLEELSKRTGNNPGPKGGISLWGVIGNYTEPEKFVSTLLPFFKELLSGSIEGGPCSFEHIIVFHEREQTEQASAIEVFLDEDKKEIITKNHDLPFAFMQF